MYLPENIDRFQVINGEEVINRFKSQIEYLEFARKTEQANSRGYTGRLCRSKQRKATATKAKQSSSPPAQEPSAKRSRRKQIPLAWTGLQRHILCTTVYRSTAAVVGEGELGLRSALELAQNASQVYYIDASPPARIM